MDDRCSECGFAGTALEVAEVAERLRALPYHVTALPLRDGDVLRRRPDAAGWSPIEYVGHLRDAMRYHRVVIERALAEEEPRIPPVEPDIFVTQGDYQHAYADELLDQLGHNIDRLAALLDSLDNKAAQRTVVVERPPRTVDISFVARSALHEGVHHLGDLKRLCYAQR